MKRKMHWQVQPREQVHEEIQNFLHALDSYPARVAKEPRINFQQHLSSFFAAHDDSDTDDKRRDQRTRRH
jgi:hypothetical protein